VAPPSSPISLEISWIDAGTLALADADPAVRDVLALCEEAEAATGGAFRAWRPDATGRVRLDPAGLVKGWAVERAATHSDDSTPMTMSRKTDRRLWPDQRWHTLISAPARSHMDQAAWRRS